MGPGEFIFVIDRSGSMDSWGGRKGRIDVAKEAMKLFLKSIPQKSRFDIISFGSGFQRMFGKTVEYNEVNLTKALNEVSTFQGDLGGTELLQPM